MAQLLQGDSAGTHGSRAPGAGSTGGGLKCGRVLLLMKSLRRNIGRVLNPQKVQVIRNNNQAVDEKILDNTNAYLAAYVIIVLFSFIAISIDGFSTTTNFSAVLSCFNNIGPGLGSGRSHLQLRRL